MSYCDIPRALRKVRSCVGTVHLEALILAAAGRDKADVVKHGPCVQQFLVVF